MAGSLRGATSYIGSAQARTAFQSANSLSSLLADRRGSCALVLDLQRAAHGFEHAQTRAAHRQGPLRVEPRVVAALADRIDAVGGVRIVEHVSDPHVLQQHMQRHAAVDQSILELGLAVEQRAARVGELVDRTPGAQHANLVQQHLFVVGIDLDGHLRGRVHVRLADEPLHVTLVVRRHGGDAHLAVDQGVVRLARLDGLGAGRQQRRVGNDGDPRWRAGHAIRLRRRRRYGCATRGENAREDCCSSFHASGFPGAGRIPANAAPTNQRAKLRL
jgi:hypothetical protein